jgi:hypothetical protein
MAVVDGWPPARVSGCTEPGLQASSPAAWAETVRCARVIEVVSSSTSAERPYSLARDDQPSLAGLIGQTPGAQPHCVGVTARLSGCSCW